MKYRHSRSSGFIKRFRGTVIPVLLVVAAMMTSCQREAAVRSALVRAEAVMEENPGAAREILDSLAYPQPLPRGKGVWSPRLQEGMGEASFALYSLLRTQAEHKCHVRATSDSLPLIATRYYGTKRKTQRAALAQHYLGCAYSDMGRDMEAIDAFLRASTLFPDTTNKYFANNLFELGILYTNHHMLDSAWVALSRYRQTETCNSDSANIGYADYYMGSVAMYKGMDDVADSLFYCVDLNTKNSVFMKKSTYFQWAKLYYSHKHENKKALAYIDKIGNYFGEGNGALLSIKADILAEEQIFSSAYELYKKAIRNSSDIYTQCSSYKELASLAPLVNKGDSTRFFINQYKELQDSIFSRSQKEKIAEIKDKHIVEVHDQQMRARNLRMQFGVGIFIVALLSVFIITLLLIDRKRKNEKLKYDEALNAIRQKQVDQLAQTEETPPDVEGYEEEPEPEPISTIEPEKEVVAESPFIALQHERITLYRDQYAHSPWPQYFKEHEADITLEKKMNVNQSKEFMLYLDNLFSDMFVVMYGSNLSLNKNDLEYCAMVMLGLPTSQMSYCTQATIHSYHCRHGKMKAMLSDDWYQIVYGHEKAKKKTG